MEMYLDGEKKWLESFSVSRAFTESNLRLIPFFRGHFLLCVNSGVPIRGTRVEAEWRGIIACSKQHGNRCRFNSSSSHYALGSPSAKKGVLSLDTARLVNAQ